MKKTILIIAAIVFTSSVFAQKYWVESSVSPHLDKNKEHKVAILPITSPSEELNGNDALKKMAYEKIGLQLSSIKNFEPVSKQRVEKAVRIFAFGGSHEVKEENYGQIASQSGANMILLCKLVKEQVMKKSLFSKNGIEVIRVTIKIYDAENDSRVVYNAKARSKNPLSDEAEVEYGVENAMEKLKKGME